MKLHVTVIKKLLNIYANYGGFQNETKLRQQLENIDLTPYERKESEETILVTTEDYINATQGKF
jgi:hypothetical protein